MQEASGVAMGTPFKTEGGDVVDRNEIIGEADPKLGRKFDKDKDRWELLPMGPVEDVVKVLTLGARKYAPDNWRYVENATDRYYAAALRHIMAWRKGEVRDEETGLPHLAHAMCDLIFLAEFDRTKEIGK